MDRMKEMIKVKGIGVVFVEFENFLFGYLGVSDVVVCGIVDERVGERFKVFVVFKSG